MFGSIVSDGAQSVAAKQMVLRPYNSARVQAASLAADPAGSVGMISVGRSSSLPLWKVAPARTSATRCGALTARQRVCAASISL